MIRFAFYGRVSTEDQQDPESSRSWQVTRSRALIESRLIESRGGVIATEFFDMDKSRSLPWRRRPEASALLAELKNKDREFDAVIVGEPHRAFYGNQYRLTFPLFEHYGVPVVGARGRRPHRPGERGPRPGHVRVRRNEQGRAEPGQDPRQAMGRTSPSADRIHDDHACS
ncbi:MAG: hypothetical protein ACRDP7_37310 [Trebonia sp.]